MKNLKYLSVFILMLFLITGCGKKETVTNKTDVTKDEKQAPEVKYKELDVTAETPVHIYFGTYRGGKLFQAVDYYSQGSRFRMKYKILEPEYKTMRWEHFYDDNNVYIRNYYNEKKSTGTLEKKESYLNEKHRFDLMFVYLKENMKDFKKTGADTALGYMCNVYKFERENINYYLYKDIVPVKIIAPSGIYLAEKIEPGVMPEDNSFDPPKEEKFKPPTPVKGPTRIGS
jgi:hypothetical protein